MISLKMKRSSRFLQKYQQKIKIIKLRQSDLTAVFLDFSRKMYLKKYEDTKFKSFAKNYTYIGIGLYALVALLIIIDNVFELFVLSGPAFILLFFGGIAYFVISLLYIKKNFAPEGEKLNIIQTLKEGIKKKEDKK